MDQGCEERGSIEFGIRGLSIDRDNGIMQTWAVQEREPVKA